MSSILNKSVVLVLNRNWQAINVRTPQEAFCMMATNVATGLEIEGEDQIRPVKWDEWIQLPVRPEDQFVRTVHGQIRVPTVIVAVNYARVPKKRPKFSARGIRERDGNRCQYTGAVLKPEEGSIDHVVPRSRGGPNSWDNCVWASKRVNAHKGNRLPDELGLKLGGAQGTEGTADFGVDRECARGSGLEAVPPMKKSQGVAVATSPLPLT
jgi:5-methylcytosine-specific restriction endonuclease McrA